MDRILELAAQQHGLIGREQALAQGMTTGQIDARVRRHRWEVTGRGVYRIPGSVPTWEQRLMTAVLATGAGGVASRQSAAALWRLPGFRPGPIEVSQFRGPSARNPGSGLHSSRFLPAHQVRLIDSIPTTCPERTLLDLCGCVHPDRAERALDNALSLELTTVQKIGLMLAETGARGRNGTALVRRLLAVRTEDYIAPESELEALLVAVLRGAGLPLPKPQVLVGGSQAPVGRVDHVYEEYRLVIEADSRRYHSAWLDVQNDHRRDLLLAAAGYTIIRVNWHQLVKEPELFLNAIRARIRPVAA